MESIDTAKKKLVDQLIKEIVRPALEEIDLGDKELLTLMKNEAELRKRIIKAVSKLSLSDQFTDEEQKSKSTYPPNYRPKGIKEQISRLHELFPEITSANEKIAEQPLPPKAEGWFAIPRWDKIAPTYSEAVKKVINLLDPEQYYPVEDYTSPYNLLQCERSIKAFKKISENQKGSDILIIPAQFGLLYRGHSIRRAREIMDLNEFGLGAFAVGVMLLTHPERIQLFRDLEIDCPGDDLNVWVGWDRYKPGRKGAPNFSIDRNKETVVEFGEKYTEFTGDHGSASGFIL